MKEYVPQNILQYISTSLSIRKKVYSNNNIKCISADEHD